MHDLVLTGGRVLDPSSGLDSVTDVAFGGGRLTAIGTGLSGAARQDVTGCLVLPGLIDLHTHVYSGGTALGVAPDAYARKTAVTTCVDTGSAGPGNFEGFRDHVIAAAQVRILAYLHISFAGIYAFSHRVMVGESGDLRLMAPRDAVEVARANPDDIIGIKVRVGRIAGGASGLAPLDIALEVADRVGLPLMAHIDEPPPSYDQVVERLRRGDVLTYCYRPFPNAPIHGDGRVHDAVRAARGRGVLFDIGHGKGSFSWPVARAMAAAGFWPDVISSDVHTLCIDGPAYDLLTTMTKFLKLGMGLPEIIEATTKAPAKAVRRPDLGGLTPGGLGEASIVRLVETEIALSDVEGEVVHHDRAFQAVGTVISGRWVAASA
ncbi:MAG: amidohydrolase/deacetylase family metallohydrolase [Pseudomonadota bacterium]